MGKKKARKELLPPLVTGQTAALRDLREFGHDMDVIQVGLRVMRHGSQQKEDWQLLLVPSVVEELVASLNAALAEHRSRESERTSSTRH